MTVAIGAFTIGTSAPVAASPVDPAEISLRQLGGDIDGDAAYDRFGFAVAINADGRTMISGAPYGIDGSGGTTGYVRIHDWETSTDSWEQRGANIYGEAHLDESGAVVAISDDGNTVVIGAPYNDGNGSNSGHARIYDWNTGTDSWVQRGNDIDGEASGDRAGEAVAINGNGNTVIIGASGNDGNGSNSGHARIYDWNTSTDSWVQRGNDIDGEADYDSTGEAVAINGNGNTVIIGDPHNDSIGANAGRARIYDWNSGADAWVQRGADIDGEAAYDRAGSAVAMNSTGDTVIIGASANDDNGSSAGHARIFDWNSGTDAWVQRGADIDGEAAYDRVGDAVAISGDSHTVILGAGHNNNANGSFAGHARIFDWDTGTGAWVQRDADIDGEAAYDQFGAAVAISRVGHTAVIGALYNDDAGSSAGSVRVIASYTSVQLGNNIVGEGSGDGAAEAVAMSDDGHTVIIGAPYNDESGGNSGHARIYDWDTGTSAWVQRGIDIDGDAVDDQFGAAVAMNSTGNTVIIGAPYNDESGGNSGHARIYDWDTGTDSWVQRGDPIGGESTDDRAGTAVAVSGDGNTVVVGSPWSSATGPIAGSVRIFAWDSGTNAWVQRGAAINGEYPFDMFGSVVATTADGNTIIASAEFVDSSDSGRVRIFDWDSGTGFWVQRGSSLDGDSSNPRFGRAIALANDGNTAVVGSPSGYVRILDWDSGAGDWVQRGADITEPAGESFGTAVAVDEGGNTVLVGAPGDSTNGSNAGAVRTFDWNSSTGTWEESNTIHHGETAADQAGKAVAASADGRMVISGAPHSNEGVARVFRSTRIAVPAPPAPIAATVPNPAQADVSWTPREEADGFPITGYLLQQSTDGSTWVLTGTPTTATVTVFGLTNDQAVQFRVIAINDIGESMPSPVSNTVTPTAAPDATVAVASGQNDPTTSTPVEFTVTFSQPVTGFDDADVTLGGTANPTGVTLTPESADTYTVSVSSADNEGTITVTVNVGAAVNANNQTSTMSNTASITINDSDAPTLVMPANIVADNDPAEGGAIVTYTIGGAVDPDSSSFGATITPTCTPASGSFFPIGTTTVTCTATDTAGNTASGSFTVTVNDAEAPTVDPASVPAPPSVDAEPGAAGAVVTYTAPTATDNDGNPVSMTCAPPSGSVFVVGTTTVECTASDSAGNTTVSNFDVVVAALQTTTTTTTTTTPTTTTTTTTTTTVAPTPDLDTELPATGNNLNQLRTTLLLGATLLLGGIAITRTTRRRT